MSQALRILAFLSLFIILFGYKFLFSYCPWVIWFSYKRFGSSFFRITAAGVIVLKAGLTSGTTTDALPNSVTTLLAS
ncbi:MAG: hypothetical protein M3297_00520 [Thermoproteota archaeon]|nr:hypothetical protein [Thermoproteota archaeon]